VNRFSSNPDPAQPKPGDTRNPGAGSENSDANTADHAPRGPDEPTLEIPLSRESVIPGPSQEASMAAPPEPSRDQAGKTQGAVSDATVSEETIAQRQTAADSISENITAGNVPSQLGRYRIEALLGRGGMGSVYRAHDTQLDRKVALKVPKFEAKTNSTLVDRFYREARSAANLAHPNLCPVFDVGVVDGTHYIAMALIKGDTLSSHIRNNGELSEKFAAITVLKIARAMQEAHGSGILHRDLKPANIMIDHRKEPIVMDFGLACPDDLDDDSRLTQEGALLGSPAYMSPEQLRGGKDSIGQQSDVYALGVVLYEILAGRLPFAGNGSTISMIGQILTEEPTDLKALRPTVNNTLAQICLKAMAKDSAERYPSMEIFGNDLERFIRGHAGRKNSANNDAKKVKAQVTQIQLNEQSKLVKTLCDSKQFDAAVPILQQIVDNPQAKDSKTHQWATATLQKVQTRINEEKQKRVAENARQVAQNPNDDPFAGLPDSPSTSLPQTPVLRPSVAPKNKPATSKNSYKIIAVVAATGLILLTIAGLWLLSRKSNAKPNATPPLPAIVDDGSSDDNDRQQATRPNQQTFDNVDRIMQRFDRDGDGFISAREVPRADKAIMMRVDVNRDGKISREEMKTSNARKAFSQQGIRPGGNNFNRGQRPPGTGPNGLDNGRPNFGGPGFNGVKPPGETNSDRSLDNKGNPGMNPGRNIPNGPGPRGDRPAGNSPFERQRQPN